MKRPLSIMPGRRRGSVLLLLSVAISTKDVRVFSPGGILPVAQAWTSSPSFSRSTASVSKRRSNVLFAVELDLMEQEAVDLLKEEQQLEQQREQLLHRIDPRPHPSNWSLWKASILNSILSLSTTHHATTKSSQYNRYAWHWWISKQVQQVLAVAYDESQGLKCPFWRRRSGDLLDGVEQILRSTIMLPNPTLLAHLPPPKPSSRTTATTSASTRTITSVAQVQQALQDDWNVGNYYISGNLNINLYSNDCLFSGPDPDLPICGLRKYVGVASRLFHKKSSKCELTKEIEILDNHTLQATWSMDGVLYIPLFGKDKNGMFRLPHTVGTTTYHLNDQFQIVHHEEHWTNVTPLQAFVETFVPSLGNLIYRK